MIYLEWYFAGPLLGLILLGLLLTINSQLGVSSSLEFVVDSAFFPREVRSEKGKQQLFFVFGLILAAMVIILSGLRVSSGLDGKIYAVENGIPLAAGAYLLGFGSRFANGCTAGHCIMGISILAKSSIIATISFFVGGLLSSHFINQLIFNSL